MKVLVTGATGFIGSHLVETLSKKGYSVRCLVRTTSNLRWLEGIPVEYTHGDLFDEEAMSEAVRGVDYIYHLAGVTKAKTKDEYFRGNQTATRNLLRVSIKSNPSVKRFVHVSSQAAVGPSTEGSPVDERTPFHPITSYGVSKMEAEKECLSVMDKLPITIVRPPAVYGPRDKDVFEFFKAVNKGLQVMIGYRDKFVSLIHAADLVDGIALAGEHPQSAGQTYFIASERPYSWAEVGEVTSRVMSKKVLRLKIPEWGVFAVAGCAQFLSMFSSKPALLNIQKGRDIVQNAWTCSIEKARVQLGFRERLTLEQGIENTVAWYREHGWL